MGLYRAKTYNFRSEGCDELEEFDIPFAIKEYLQNTTGQFLKALEVRKWREWERTDLSGNSSDIELRRETTKARLVKDDPCLFAGVQGKAIAKSKNCQPRYVLEATLSQDELRENWRNHDLRAIIILWGFGLVHDDDPDSTHFMALTVYNNYLDPHTKFSHFVHDGASTSKENDWAVGLKGKGFILSTSYLAQECDYQKAAFGGSLGFGRNTFGVGFNMGSRFGKSEYNKTWPRILKMKKEDLRTLSLQAFKRENPTGKLKDVESDDDTGSEHEYDFLNGLQSSRMVPFARENKIFEDRISKTNKKREDLHLAPKAIKQEERMIGRGKAFVQEDDVCIHVIGLPGSLSAQEAFSANFGIFPESKVWTVPEASFEIFDGGTTGRFYHRDQLVPECSPLGRLGINYHGDLSLTSDRRAIIRGDFKHGEFERGLTKALDIAISTYPDLAVLLMQQMIDDQNRHLQRFLTPPSKDHGLQWKEAFEKAHGETVKPIYPYAQRAREAELIEEFGLTPVPLPDWQIQVLEDAGAYQSIIHHAKKCLADARKIDGFQPLGRSLLIDCIRELIPGVDITVSIREYYHSFPKALRKDELILLARPQLCKECPEGQCICWVRPTLVRIMQEKNEYADLDLIFQVYDRVHKLAQDRKEKSSSTRDPRSRPRENDARPGEAAIISASRARLVAASESDVEDSIQSTPQPKKIPVNKNTTTQRTIRRRYGRPIEDERISPEVESQDLPTRATRQLVTQGPEMALRKLKDAVKLTETNDTVNLQIHKEIKMTGKPAIDSFRLHHRNTALDAARNINSLAEKEAEMIVGMHSTGGNPTDSDQPGAKRQRNG